VTTASLALACRCGASAVVQSPVPAGPPDHALLRGLLLAAGWRRLPETWTLLDEEGHALSRVRERGPAWKCPDCVADREQGEEP
jgi:hypothetical protein